MQNVSIFIDIKRHQKTNLRMGHAHLIYKLLSLTFKFGFVILAFFN